MIAVRLRVAMAAMLEVSGQGRPGIVQRGSQGKVIVVIMVVIIVVIEENNEIATFT